MEIEELLDGEIQQEFSTLKKMGMGTEEYKTSVDGLTKLLDRAIEMKKIDIEEDDRIETREFENDLKLKQMKDDKIDRWVKNGLTVLGIAVPTAVTIWGTLKSFKFEEEGTITTIMGRGFINKLLPKK